MKKAEAITIRKPGELATPEQVAQYAAKARILKKEGIKYEFYLNQISLRKRIEEHIRLAKKRSMIQDV